MPGTRRVLVSLLPAPGTAYPEVADPDLPPPVPAPTPLDQRFSIQLQPAVPDTAFVGFLGSKNTHFKPTAGTLVWGEDFDPAHPLLSAADLRPQGDDNQQSIDDEGPPDPQGPRDLTLAMYLHGLGGSDTAAGGFDGQEHVDPRTRQPAPDDADDDTVGVAPPGVLSPNFGRDSDYDDHVSRSCTPAPASRRSRSTSPTPSRGPRSAWSPPRCSISSDATRWPSAAARPTPCSWHTGSTARSCSSCRPTRPAATRSTRSCGAPPAARISRTS